MLTLFMRVSAQSETYENYFYAQIMGENVVLNFELRTGAICFGIQVERRSEHDNFEQIGVIPGICGSEDHPVSFVFRDENPLTNQRSFYRLIFNELGISREIEVFVPDLSEKPYSLAIEPNAQKLAVFFRNTLGQTVHASFFSLEGKTLFDTSSQSNFIILPDLLLTEKLVIFRLSFENGRIITGKLMLM